MPGDDEVLAVPQERAQRSGVGLEEIPRPGLEQRVGIEAGLRAATIEAGLPVCLRRVGSMSCMFFTDADVVDWQTASTAETDRYAAYFRAMLDAGVVLAPSQFEATFLGLAHSDADIDMAVEAARSALSAL